MWKIISFILGAIVVYLLVRFRDQSGTKTNIKIFRGTETHAVILLNDDVNTMERIVNNLVKIIGISERYAINLMMKTHLEGIAVIWSGPLEEGKTHLQSMRDMGFRCFPANLTTDTL